MHKNKTELMEEKKEDLLGDSAVTTALNTLHKYIDHHQHLNQHMSKMDEERPCDTKDGNSIIKNKQQPHNSCDPTSTSVTSTSSWTAENNAREQTQLENQIHNHHHHHHHYHNHYYNYYSNEHRVLKIL